MPSILRQSPIHAHHMAHEAVMAAQGGWTMPLHYGDTADEAKCVREGVGVMDQSACGKIDLSGVTLPAWASERFGKESAAAPMQAAGIMLDSSISGVICRLREDKALLLTPPEHTVRAVDLLMQSAGDGMHITDVTSVYAALLLAGPGSLSVLHKLTSLDVRPSRFPNRACLQGPVARVSGVILRDDIGNLPAYRILVTRDYGEFVWEAAFHSGEAYGIAPFGAEAYGMLAT